MNEALRVLEPYLAAEEKQANGKVLIATVKGDMHDIGIGADGYGADAGEVVELAKFLMKSIG